MHNNSDSNSDNLHDAWSAIIRAVGAIIHARTGCAPDPAAASGAEHALLGAVDQLIAAMGEVEGVEAMISLHTRTGTRSTWVPTSDAWGRAWGQTWNPLQALAALERLGLDWGTDGAEVRVDTLPPIRLRPAVMVEGADAPHIIPCDMPDWEERLEEALDHLRDADADDSCAATILPLRAAGE